MRARFVEENNTRSDVLGNDTARSDLEDPVSNWSLDIETLEDPNTALNEKPDDFVDDSQFEEFDDTDLTADSLPELSLYKDFISKLPAYKWLLESVQNVLYMDVPGDVQTNIRQAVLDCLPRSQVVSRGALPERFSLTFTADWDPCALLAQSTHTNRSVCQRSQVCGFAVSFLGSKLSQLSRREK
jgi:hypothetical protein